MINRLHALPWGWIVIGLAHGIAVLPIFPQHRLFWLALVVAMAYFVLAIRTTHATAELAQSSDESSIFTLWRTAFRTTLIHRALLVLPMFCLAMAAQSFMVVTATSCPVLFRAYCMTYNNGLQPELLLLSASVIGVFLLLDHGLLVALTLLAQIACLHREHCDRAAFCARLCCPEYRCCEHEYS